MTRSRPFGFSCSIADCHRIHQCWHQGATCLPYWIQCRIVFNNVPGLGTGLLRKLAAVDLAETDQQDKASMAPEAERERFWTKRGKSWTGCYSTTGADSLWDLSDTEAKLDLNISEDKPWGIEVPWAKLETLTCEEREGMIPFFSILYALHYYREVVFTSVATICICNT